MSELASAASCGCRVTIEGDELHVWPCADADHAAALVKAAAEIVKRLDKLFAGARQIKWGVVLRCGCVLGVFEGGTDFFTRPCSPACEWFHYVIDRAAELGKELRIEDRRPR